MVVGDLHVFSARSLPSEDDAPLVINSYCMISGQIAAQQMEVVARRHPQIVQLRGRVDQAELGKRYFLNPSRQLPASLLLKNLPGLPITKATNQLAENLPVLG